MTTLSTSLKEVKKEATTYSLNTKISLSLIFKGMPLSRKNKLNFELKENCDDEKKKEIVDMIILAASKAPFHGTYLDLALLKLNLIWKFNFSLQQFRVVAF